MKKITSKKSVLLRSFLLLPLLAVMLYGFSETKIIEKQKTILQQDHSQIVTGLLPNQKGATDEQIKEYNALAKKYNAVPMEKRIIPLNDLKTLETVYRKMNADQRESSQPFPECQQLKNNIEILINEHGQLYFEGQLLKIEELPSALVKFNSKSSKEEREKSVRSVVKVDKGTPQSVIDQVDQILMDYGVATINIVGPETGLTVQDGASRKQMAEYNQLAKHYNGMSKNNMRIKMKDVERLKYIYSLMSDKQRADAEPFPDFPEPPPIPEAPNAPNPPEVKMREKSDIPPPPPTPDEADLMEIREIAPPIPPKSPLDHVIEMAKKDATFYYEGKKISSDKAIQLLKKNKSLNIDSRGSRGDRPIIRISKKPIKIGRVEKSSPSVPSSDINVKTGNIEINGESHFYSTKNGVTSYFNGRGEQVDKNGRLLSQNLKKNPKFYFNGKQISSEKANRLLSSNTSIQVTNEEYSDKEYAIILTDLNNPNKQNQNLLNNPNSVIDLTEVISKGAVFFYNDEPISTEKALWLTQKEYIERVQVKEGSNKQPEVFFWDND